MKYESNNVLEYDDKNAASRDVTDKSSIEQKAIDQKAMKGEGNVDLKVFGKFEVFTYKYIWFSCSYNSMFSLTK